MSFRQPQDATPELSTTRVASGGSARLIALGVAGVLFAVVGIVVVSRPSETSRPSPTNGAFAAAPTNTPSPTPLPSPALIPVAVVPVRDYGFQAAIQITGGTLRTALQLDAPETYRSWLDIPLSSLAKDVPLEIGRAYSAGGPVIYESFGAWTVSLKSIRGTRGAPVVVFIHHVPPDTHIGPDELAAGYTFAITASHDRKHLHLMLELIWPATAHFGV